MRPQTRRRLTFLTGFAAYFAVLWLLWPTPIVYPLKVFVVFLHELSHGLMAVATGGRIESIALDWREGGETVSLGGSAILTLSAGYLGSERALPGTSVFGQSSPRHCCVRVFRSGRS